MTTIRFCLCFFLIAVGNLLKSQDYALSNPSVLYSDQILLKKAQWSTDGQRLLITGYGNKGLYLYNLIDSSLECLDTNRFRDAKFQGINTINYIENGLVLSKSLSKTKAADTEKGAFAFVDIGEKELYLKSFEQNELIKLSSEPLNYYNPILSPDGLKVVVNIGANIFLMTTDGSGEKVKLTDGLVGSWSFDSKKIYLFKDQSTDGHAITNSDLFVFDLTSMQETQLTFTNDQQEMWPAVSPDNSSIIYFENIGGELYIADLKITE